MNTFTGCPSTSNGTAILACVPNLKCSSLFRNEDNSGTLLKLSPPNFSSAFSFEF